MNAYTWKLQVVLYESEPKINKMPNTSLQLILKKIKNVKEILATRAISAGHLASYINKRVLKKPLRLPRESRNSNINLKKEKNLYH